MKILQINTVVNSGSTGRIAEDIGKVLLSQGHSSSIAYGRGPSASQSRLIKVGNDWDMYMHGLTSKLFDRHGFSSKAATKRLIADIEKIEPDVIGLHNLHGYYLNIEVLFDFLKATQLPVLWTLFDCWAFTGHCAYFDKVGCQKWKTCCSNCELKRTYPSSFYLDNSTKNYLDKKRLFQKLPYMDLVVHSRWLENLTKQSFLSDYPIHVIHSGIDLNIFKPDVGNAKDKYNIPNKQKIILGCANIWNARKGLNDFLYLRQALGNEYNIVLVGLGEKQIRSLPEGIIGIKRTESVVDLASLYSIADVFVNPTTADNFPTTNIEALACGTPVITYDTGGSGEAIDEHTGIVVEKGNKERLYNAVIEVVNKGKVYYSPHCVARAKTKFNKEDRYRDYIDIFEKKVNKE